MTVSTCHMTADGQGMVNFFKAWSEFALNDKTSIIPNHDRSVILPREAFMEFVGGSPQPMDDSEKKTAATSEQERRTDPGDAYRLRAVGPLNKIWHVKRKAVEDLKRKAAEENVAVTTVDLISAHLWQSVSSLVDSDEMPSLLSTYVDGRKRFHDTPLPETYIGNAVVPVSTPPIPLKELASTHFHLQPVSSTMPSQA